MKQLDGLASLPSFSWRIFHQSRAEAETIHSAGMQTTGHGRLPTLAPDLGFYATLPVCVLRPIASRQKITSTVLLQPAKQADR